MLDILIQHGWGFASNAWRDWLCEFALRTGFKITARCPDRNYYTNGSVAPSEIAPVLTHITPDGTSAQPDAKVVIAHSLGLHFLPNELVAQCDLLVAISCFAQFHDLGDSKTRRIADRMLRKFDIEPLVVVEDFLHNCYSPPPPSSMMVNPFLKSSELNVTALKTDLKLLQESRIAVKELAKAKQVLLLHGTADSIVDPGHSKLMHAGLPNSSLVLFEGEGHALPFTNPGACHLAISACLSQQAKDNRVSKPFLEIVGNRHDQLSKATRAQAMIAGIATSDF